MSFIACNEDGMCVLSNGGLERDEINMFGKKMKVWLSDLGVVHLPNEAIKKLIGRELTYQDEPVEIPVDYKWKL